MIHILCHTMNIHDKNVVLQLHWQNVFSVTHDKVLSMKLLLVSFYSTGAQISQMCEIEEPIAFDITRQLTLLLTLDW